MNTCPHFGICGGCLYQDIPYSEELQIKEEMVRGLLAPVVDDLSDIFHPIVASPRDTEYRNKMEFSFGDEEKGGPLMLGMHKRGAFYDIVTVDSCNIIDGDFRSILTTTLEFFRESGCSFYHKRTQTGFLRHLLVRKAAFTGEILVDIVTASGMDKGLLARWSEAIKALDFNGSLAGILHTENDRASDVVEDQGTEILFGKDYFNERLLALSFKITPFSFFQTNPYGAEELYSLVRRLAPEKGNVFDLYCGTGTIGQLMAAGADHVIGVEIVEEAVRAARENAEINNITNAEFIAGDVKKVMADIHEDVDLIILDPPREGIIPKAMKQILSFGAKTIIYVSCKPKSLARDLPELINAGYIPDYIQPVDMFPRTGNVETVCRLKGTFNEKI